jgi:hypothetical protein
VHCQEKEGGRKAAFLFVSGNEKAILGMMGIEMMLKNREEK